MRIILTPEDGMSSVHRWKTETPYLMSLIEKHIVNGATVLDYGCGIGRLAKPLIEKHSCDVIGVDISPNMRALAASCVDKKFVAVASRYDCGCFAWKRPTWRLQYGHCSIVLSRS